MVELPEPHHDNEPGLQWGDDEDHLSEDTYRARYGKCLPPKPQQQPQPQFAPSPIVRPAPLGDRRLSRSGPQQLAGWISAFDQVGNILPPLPEQCLAIAMR